MHFSFANTAAWQLLKEFDFMGWFILSGLMLFSVFCIAIIAFKYITFKRNTASLEALIIRIKNARTFSEIISISKEFKGTIGGKFLMINLSELKMILDGNTKKKSVSPETGAVTEEHASLTAKDIERLELSLGQSLDNAILEEESYLPMFSTSAAVGPLMGLFGTVWGLIRAFVDISQEKSADIATVAPGMAVALITTLAGLIVAIPSYIAYHYLANKVKIFEKQLSEIAERFLLSAKQTFVK